MPSISQDPTYKPLTRLAILRTVGSLHAEPLRYDLERLRSIIIKLAPDLLCADITREAWEGGDLSTASLEIREALAPAIALTDTVLVPIGPTDQQYTDYQASPGWRQRLATLFDRLLDWGQRKADEPEAINGMSFQLFCHTVCELEELTWTQADQVAYKARTAGLAANIIEAAQHDPGGRVLVVVQCQWHHSLEPLLKRAGDWLEIVDYRNL